MTAHTIHRYTIAGTYITARVFPHIDAEDEDDAPIAYNVNVYSHDDLGDPLASFQVEEAAEFCMFGRKIFAALAKTDFVLQHPSLATLMEAK